MNRPYFINVDVELTSKESLSVIANELAGNVTVMESRKVGDAYQFNFECILPSESVGGPHAILEAVINLLEGLSDGAKQALLCCEKRVIDIGYNSGVVGWVYTSIPSEALLRMTKLNFDLNISIYGLDPSAKR